MKPEDWISVDNQLPPRGLGVDVLVYTPEDDQFDVAHWDGTEFMVHDDYWFKVHPTHWQPVVKP